MLKSRAPFKLIHVALAVLIVGCATTGPGGKQSLILIPTSQEIAIGQGMAQQIKQEEKLLDDPEWQAYVTEIGNRIVAVSDRRDIEYHFAVIESDVPNAFAVPGGWIYFYTGLLKEMDSESEFAAVCAHEISHVVARHSVQRLQAAMGASLAYQLIFGDNGSDALNAAVNVGMGLLFADYSRDDEREADRFGMIYMRKAGYNPRGALDMFEVLAKLGGGGGQNVFEALASSHPDTQERINNAEALLSDWAPLSDDLVTGRDRYQQMKARLPGN